MDKEKFDKLPKSIQLGLDMNKKRVEMESLKTEVMELEVELQNLKVQRMEAENTETEVMLNNQMTQRMSPPIVVPGFGNPQN